jgi:hypothetical protein
MVKRKRDCEDVPLPFLGFDIINHHILSQFQLMPFALLAWRAVCKSTKKVAENEEWWKVIYFYYYMRAHTNIGDGTSEPWNFGRPCCISSVVFCERFFPRSFFAHMKSTIRRRHASDCSLRHWYSRNKGSAFKLRHFPLHSTRKKFTRIPEKKRLDYYSSLHANTITSDLLDKFFKLFDAVARRDSLGNVTLDHAFIFSVNWDGYRVVVTKGIASIFSRFSQCEYASHGMQAPQSCSAYVTIDSNNHIEYLLDDTYVSWALPNDSFYANFHRFNDPEFESGPSVVPWGNNGTHRLVINTEYQ